MFRRPPDRRWRCSAAIGMSAASAAQLAQLQPGQRPAAGTDEAELWYGMEQPRSELRAIAAAGARSGAERLRRRRRLQGRRPATAGTCASTSSTCRCSTRRMAPNGAMIVWTGALLRMRDEAELAVRARPRIRPLQARGIRSAMAANSEAHHALSWALSAWSPAAAGVPDRRRRSALIGGMSLRCSSSVARQGTRSRPLGFAAARRRATTPSRCPTYGSACCREEKADRTHSDRRCSPATRKARNASSTSAPPRHASRLARQSRNAEAYRAAMRPFQRKLARARNCRAAPLRQLASR